MGLKLVGLLEEVIQTLNINELQGKRIGIDAYNQLYAFLSAIRNYGEGGGLFTDSEGNVTSHLIGLKSRLLYFQKAGIYPVYVFDGKPPDFKRNEIAARKEAKVEAQKLYAAAIEAGNMEEAAKYAQRTSIITATILDDAKRLLTAFGVPWFEAASESEAQLALMTINGDIYAAATQDYDALLFGTPRVIRNISISQKRTKNGQKIESPPQFLRLEHFLSKWEITREQLILMALMIGTDYNNGVHGIGPKSALKLVKTHSTLDKLLTYLRKNKLAESEQWQHAFPFEPEALYNYFLNPEVMVDYKEKLTWQTPDKTEIVRFLVDERGFEPERLAKDLKISSKGPSSSAQNLMKFFPSSK